MPAGFDWCDIDVTDATQLQEFYVLLSENYVEDDDCHFRFDYSQVVNSEEKGGREKVSE